MASQIAPNNATSNTLQAKRGQRFVSSLASSEEEIRACQQLRYRIFAGELGAQIDGGSEHIDRDRFDYYCRHLVVRDGVDGPIIACTRLLTDDAARRAGGFYSAGEFDMAAIAALPDRKVEVGRTCVQAEYRSGAVISALWGGLAKFFQDHGYRYLFGCASIPLDDGGDQAAVILDKIRRRYMAPAELHVTPRKAWETDDLPAEVAMRMPPLLKAYVSLGAQACGEPYWDTDFNCADVFMLLDVHALAPRYARRFTGRFESNSVASEGDFASDR